MRKHWIHLFLGLTLGTWMAAAQAHKLSDSYLTIHVADDRTTLTGRWDIALRDLDHAVGLDVDGDTAITWGEVKSRQDTLASYALSRLALGNGESGDAPCPLRFERLLANQHVDGGYAVLQFTARCRKPVTQLSIGYSLLFDLDPDHRGLLDVRASGSSRTASLSERSPSVSIPLNTATPIQELASFVADGFWHILHGYDHVLFLMTLLLPAVVVYRDGRWQPGRSLRESVLGVAGVVTAFTAAHSLTLALGVFGWIQLPSRLVESAIAATVVLGALNNLMPVVTDKRWLVAFVFGLVHGLGFASVLADFGLERGALALALTGFNIGVELGQLGVVLVLVPIAFTLRETKLYRRFVMPAGAVAIGCIATYWFVLRALGA